MTYREYSDAQQMLLADGIRQYSEEHRHTPLYLWRTALEQSNPDVLIVPPYCRRAWLGEVYALLDVAKMD